MVITMLDPREVNGLCSAFLELTMLYMDAVTVAQAMDDDDEDEDAEIRDLRRLRTQLAMEELWEIQGRGRQTDR